MTVIDKIIAAITPLPSPEARAGARDAARHVARPGDWFSNILDQHERIEAAFATLKAAAPGDRPSALKELGALLNGHAMAEEAVIYPTLAAAGAMISADAAYVEQIGLKLRTAELERLDPASDAFREKLDHLEGAVTHHAFEEESQWLPDLARKASMADQATATQRFAEEFDRYMRGGTRGDGAEPLDRRHAVVPVEPRSFGDEPERRPGSTDIGTSDGPEGAHQ